MIDSEAGPTLAAHAIKRGILIPDEDLKIIYNSMTSNSKARKGEVRNDWRCFGLSGIAAFKEYIRRCCSRCLATGISYTELKRAGSGLSVDR